MKIKRLPILMLITASFGSYAQWQTTGNNIFNSNSGNVGIGTSTPNEKLSVKSGTNTRIRIGSDGDGSYYTGEMGGLLFTKHYDINQCAKIYTYSNGGTSSYNGADLRFATSPQSGGVTDRMIIDQNGNIGIGRTSAFSKVHIYDNNAPFLRIGKGGDAGFYTGEVGGITFSKHYDLNLCAKIYAYSNGGSSSYNGAEIRFATSPQNGSPTDRMVIGQDGNIGIGTSTPNTYYKLDVIGNLHVDGRIDTKDVCVSPTGFCDFVFDESYKLMSVDSLKNYISKNKHLPHFPSEKQIVKNGMSMTDITLSQTRTIEELVLYTIKQQELIEKLEKRINNIETSKK